MLRKFLYYLVMVFSALVVASIIIFIGFLLCHINIFLGMSFLLFAIVFLLGWMID